MKKAQNLWKCLPCYQTKDTNYQSFSLVFWVDQYHGAGGVLVLNPLKTRSCQSGYSGHKSVRCQLIIFITQFIILYLTKSTFWTCTLASLKCCLVLDSQLLNSGSNHILHRSNFGTSEKMRLNTSPCQLGLKFFFGTNKYFTHICHIFWSNFVRHNFFCNNKNCHQKLSVNFFASGLKFH